MIEITRHTTAIIESVTVPASMPAHQAMTLEQMIARDGFSAIKRYHGDPTYRAEVDAEVAANRDAVNTAIDAGMAGLNAKQQARWAAEEAAVQSNRGNNNG